MIFKDHIRIDFWKNHDWNVIYLLSYDDKDYYYIFLKNTLCRNFIIEIYSNEELGYNWYNYCTGLYIQKQVEDGWPIALLEASNRIKKYTSLL